MASCQRSLLVCSSETTSSYHSYHLIVIILYQFVACCLCCIILQAFGRLSFTIEAAASAPGHFQVNLTLSDRFKKSPPPGGIALRLRAPGHLTGKRITAATVGGKPLPATAIDVTAEAVLFSAATLTSAAAADLQKIAVELS